VDDFDDLGSAEEPEAEQQAVSDDVAKRLAKLEKDNAKLREENKNARLKLRRSEIQEGYGSQIAELIPEELPQDKWQEYAEKLKGLVPSTQPPEGEDTEAATKWEPSEDEKRLAAVNKGPSSAAEGTKQAMSAVEWMRLRAENPSEADRALVGGRVEGVNPR